MTTTEERSTSTTEVTGRNAAKEATELANAGRITEAIKIARRWDSAWVAVKRAGWTMDGTPIRAACPCRFYEAAPGAHDRLLDLPDLSPDIICSRF